MATKSTALSRASKKDGLNSKGGYSTGKKPAAKPKASTSTAKKALSVSNLLDRWEKWSNAPSTRGRSMSDFLMHYNKNRPGQRAATAGDLKTALRGRRLEKASAVANAKGSTAKKSTTLSRSNYKTKGYN